MAQGKRRYSKEEFARRGQALVESKVRPRLTVADEERFARPDTSVTGQVLKLLAANPDAILIGASGTAAALNAFAPMDPLMSTTRLTSGITSG